MDWVSGQSKTISYPSVSFASDKNSYSPSLTLLFTATDEATRTQVTLGLPNIPSSNPLEHVVSAYVATVVVKTAIVVGGITLRHPLIFSRAHNLTIFSAVSNNIASFMSNVW